MTGSISFSPHVKLLPAMPTTQIAEREPRNPEVQAEDSKKNQIPPEEMLQKIKALTEDGLYSVRFERHPDLGTLVIKLVEQETGELIRQVPAEEILNISKSLRDYRGIVIDTAR